MSVQLESAKYLWWGGEHEKEGEGSLMGGKGQRKDKEGSPSACTHAHRSEASRTDTHIHSKHSAETEGRQLTVPSNEGSGSTASKGRRREGTYWVRMNFL